ncbi:MAG TPA: hypothetical protein VFL91_21375 [Thermomicrobiales bacterium]|nr:hypothetical protein [Thermomicrobiales bacterium]
MAEADALARRLFADWMARPRVWPVEADGGWRLYNRALLRWIRRRDARRLRLAAAFGMDAHRYRLRSLAKLQAARGARLSSYERGG